MKSSPLTRRYYEFDWTAIDIPFGGDIQSAKISLDYECYRPSGRIYYSSLKLHIPAIQYCQKIPAQLRHEDDLVRIIRYMDIFYTLERRRNILVLSQQPIPPPPLVDRSIFTPHMRMVRRTMMRSVWLDYIDTLEEAQHIKRQRRSIAQQGISLLPCTIWDQITTYLQKDDLKALEIALA